MTPNRLAGLVSIAIALGAGIAWLITRKIMRRPAAAGSGIVIVATWTLFAGGIPYAVFVFGVSAARGHGSLTGVASLVIGVLPLILIAAPVTGLIFTIRHFSQHVRAHFSLGDHGGTIPARRRNRGHGIRDRNTGDSDTALDRAEDQGNSKDNW